MTKDQFFPGKLIFLTQNTTVVISNKIPVFTVDVREGECIILQNKLQTDIGYRCFVPSKQILIDVPYKDLISLSQQEFCKNMQNVKYKFWAMYTWRKARMNKFKVNRV